MVLISEMVELVTIMDKFSGLRLQMGSEKWWLVYCYLP
jgi:hypothetical protein